VIIDRRFPRQVCATLVIISGLAAYPLIRFGTREMIIAAGAGALLSTVNVLLGFLTVEFAFEKSYTTFLKAVLGGMGIRMVMMLGAMLVLIMLVQLHALALMISLLGFYLVYLILEVLFLQRRVLEKGQR
jgi:hypothetical protein